MLFPFHAHLSDGVISARQLVETFTAEGITAIEPMMSWVEAEPEKWAELDRAAREAGLVYSCYDIEVNLVGESDADLEQALEQVERGVAFCRDSLGCGLAIVAGTKPASGMSDAEGRRIYGETLREAATRIRGKGVSLNIENYGVHPTFTASGAHCLEVLNVSGCPEIGFVHDNGNFLLGGDTPAHAYNLLKDRTVHVHIKDFTVSDPDYPNSLPSPDGTRYKSCPTGEGDAEVVHILNQLKADGYDGWLSLEVGGNTDPVAAAVQGARFVKQVWGS